MAPGSDGALPLRRRLDENRMQQLAGRIGAALPTPLVVYLEGDLGAGKTTFARALIKGAGYTGRVKSPTYGILEHYPVGEVEFLHLDLYRIADSDELDFLGIADLLSAHSVLLVEWPGHGAGRLPRPDLTVTFSHDGEVRSLVFQAHSNSGIRICDSILENTQSEF